ncbi:MAG: hypothetical protein WCF85_06845 [Rhodospirillaceae bacterium]
MSDIVSIRSLIRALQGAALVLLLLVGAGAAFAADDKPDLPRGWQLPVRISVAMRILDIAQILETQGQMNARVEITYRWSDPRLAFDKVKEGVPRLDFFDAAAKVKLQKIWNPSVEIENLAGSPRQDQLGLSIAATGEVMLVRTVDANFRISTNLAEFPFDSQRLTVHLVSTRYGLQEVVLVHTRDDDASSGFTRTPLTPLWLLKRLDFLSSSYVAWNGDSHSRMAATVVADRKWPIYLARVYLPFLLVMSISLFTLWPKEYNPGSKGPQIFSGLLALVALGFTYEAQFPGSMSANTPIATMVSSGFIYLITALTAYIMLMNPAAEWAERNPGFFSEMRSVVSWGVPLLALIYWASLIATSAV